MSRKTTGHRPKDARGESTYEVLPMSVQTRLNMHPRLFDVFERLGGGDWLRQMLVREDIRTMEEGYRNIVQSKLMMGINYADAVLIADRMPGAIVTVDGRVMSQEAADSQGLEVGQAPDLPDDKEIALSPRISSPGAPRDQGGQDDAGRAMRPIVRPMAMPAVNNWPARNVIWCTPLEQGWSDKWRALLPGGVPKDDPIFKLRPYDRVKQDLGSGFRAVIEDTMEEVPLFGKMPEDYGL